MKKELQKSAASHRGRGGGMGEGGGEEEGGVTEEVAAPQLVLMS